MKNKFSHRGIASWMIVLVCLFLFVSSGWASFCSSVNGRCFWAQGCSQILNPSACPGTSVYTNNTCANGYATIITTCVNTGGNSYSFEENTYNKSQVNVDSLYCARFPSAPGCKTPAEICLEKQSECEQLGGTFNGDVAESNECVFLCEIKLQNKQTAIKYTNENKYFVIDNSVASLPAEIEISQSIFNDLKDINSTCKESLFRGILNGSYIYWHSNQDTPANVNHIIKLR